VVRQALDPVLTSLVERWPNARALVLDREAGALLAWWPRQQAIHGSAGVGDPDRPPAAVLSACREVVLTGQVTRRPLVTIVGGREVTAAQVRWGDEEAVLALVRPHPAPPAEEAFGLALAVCDRLMAQSVTPARTRLDDLVTDVATVLAGVTAHALSPSLDAVVEMAGRFFAVDTCFLRRHDFAARASVLVSEWPARREIADPDPLGVVPFDVEDPVFGAIELLDAPLVILPSSDAQEYQQRVFAGSGVSKVSLAMVPLRSDVTVGVLGFIHFGERAWAESEIRALRAIAGLLTQVLARVDAEQQMQTLAFRDPLTGLANRRAFLEDVQRRLDDVERRKFALAFIDLDRLKTMNDILGHAVGDAMIVASATRMATAIGPDDLAARLGGDEFVIVFDGVDAPEVALARAERMLAELRRPVPIGISPLHRSASIGVVLAGQAKTSADELLRAADVALLEAKGGGGDQVVVFNEVLQRRSLQRADLELRLENALTDGELELFYQPEFDLRTREILAGEALVRWRHPERGLLDAGEFIGVVEETNASRRLGRWVQEQACRQLADWSRLVAGRPFALRVNVTPGEFLAADFVDDFRATLARHGVRAQQVCLEITESAVMRDVPGVVAALRLLRHDGVLLAIDDFGTGHSSLAQLRNLPVDVLKIDRSFVTGLDQGRGGRAIVAGVLGLARSLGLQTVVEGVETEAEASILVGLGCRRAQGYLVAPALPADEFAALLGGPAGTADVVSRIGTHR